MSSTHSAFFSLLSQFVQVLITFGLLAILARILTPEDFGLMAIVLAVYGLFLPFLDMGLTVAYIKLDQVDSQTQQAFFTMNVMLGLAVMILMLAVSPLVAYLFQKDVLKFLVSAYACVALLQSAAQQPMANLIRNKRFDAILVINFLAALSGGALAVVAAVFFNLGIWSLVLQAVGSTLVLVIAGVVFSDGSYRLTGWRQVKLYKSSMHIAIGTTISRLLIAVSSTFERMLFAKLFSTNILGQYTKAMDVARIADDKLRMALTTPALSYLARHNDMNGRYRYLLMTNAVLLLACIPCTFLIVFGERVFPWLMGEQWYDAGVYAQWLGLWGIGKILQGISVVIYTNENQLRIFIRLNILALLVPVLAAFFGWYADSALLFIKVLSVVNFLFWLIVMTLTMNAQINYVTPFLRGVFTIIIPPCLFGYYMKQNFLTIVDVGAGSFYISLAIVMMMMVTLLSVVMFNRPFMRQLWPAILSLKKINNVKGRV